MSKSYLAACLVLIVCPPALTFGVNEEITMAKEPRGGPLNEFYEGNRPPLLPSPLIKLPVGSIEPGGWLRTQLERQADGFVGHLTEISRFLKKDGNAWLSKTGEGHSPWEEMPYWLKGFGDTGYVLRDQRIIAEAREWIEAVLASQREDGYFGPRANLTHIKANSDDGKPDLWPNMIMLNALQSYYEFTSDRQPGVCRERVLQLMTKYFRWQAQIPDDDFLLPFWQQQRAADNLASVYWLYNRTGDKSLLDLASKIHRNTAPWSDGIASWHGVNIAQAFRGPANYYVQSKDEKDLRAAERNYDEVMSIYGQVPGGMFGADENCRPGFIGPRQAAETCTMAEFMLSFEMLLGITGHVKWADRCEDVAFNSLPASMTPDLKALRYLTAPNMILSDRHSKKPGLQNGGSMLLFNPHGHRCCQHNVAHGWPYFAEHLWMATASNGLAAVLYAPCQVKAKVGNGTEITILQNTFYPFDENIELTLSAPRAVRFPLYLRVPGWCEEVNLTINGAPATGQVARATGQVATADRQSAGEPVKATPASYIVVDRTWADGDKILLQLHMPVTVTRWSRNHNCASVSRGPLTYSLKIGEKYVRQGGAGKLPVGGDDWPAYEVHPTTAWNYGLVLNEADPASSFQVVRKLGSLPDQPFESETAPIELRAKARKIPNWRKDYLGLVGPVQPSPVKSAQPIETVTLVPMGCQRLRIAAFPVIGEGPETHEWVPPTGGLPGPTGSCRRR